MITPEVLATRKIALDVAQSFVQHICSTHPPEAYRMTTGPTAIFSIPAGTTMTPAEQVVSMSISVADWLLEGE